MKHTAVTHLVFDLDNTLVDADAAYDFGLRQVGFSPDDPAYLQAKKAVKRRLGDRHVSSHHRLLYFKEISDQSGQFNSGPLLRQMERYELAVAKEYARQWEALSRYRLMESFQGRYRMAIMTNETTRTQLIKLGAIDPQSALFPVVVTSEEAGVEKPDPRIFELLEARLGTRPGGHLGMIGDSFTDDMAPALSRGYRCWMTREFSKRPLQSDLPEALTVIDRLDDLRYKLGNE